MQLISCSRNMPISGSRYALNANILIVFSDVSCTLLYTTPTTMIISPRTAGMIRSPEGSSYHTKQNLLLLWWLFLTTKHLSVCVFIVCCSGSCGSVQFSGLCVILHRQNENINTIRSLTWRQKCVILKLWGMLRLVIQDWFKYFEATREWWI